MASPAESHGPEDVVPEGKRVAPLELFYDLVFVVRAVSSSAALVLVAVLLTACAPPPRPVTLDDAIKAAINDAGMGSAEQLYRGGCENRTCVVVAKADDPRSIALIVLETAAPYRVVATSSGKTDKEPATMDEMGTDDTEFIYGRIDDGRIAKLELDLLDGETLSFDVAQPGYAVAYPGMRGPVQASRFLDAAGRVITG